MLADIELVKKIVVTAGKQALSRKGTVGVEYKADQSLVTMADKESEQYISAELSRAYPDYAFIGEEFGWHGPDNAPVWSCDPIDGTTNFVFDLPLWGVSVGLLDKGVPELGAIYLPCTDELFWAVRGQGAFCNGVRLQTTDRDSLHPEDTLNVTSNAIKSLNPEALPCRIRSLGTIAAELAYTARGSLCGTVGLYEGIVDMAAGFVICTEAGCIIHNLAGDELDINALLIARRTDEHFVVAPPRLTALLKRTLKAK